MATFWQKTLFYLGLVDDDSDVDQGVPAPASSPAQGDAPRVVTALSAGQCRRPSC